MKQSWLWTLIALIAVSVVSYGIYQATRPEQLPGGFLYGNGHIEGREIRIASEVAGRVTEQALTEGAQVTKGQLLVAIDYETSRDQLSAREGELLALRDSRAALRSQITVWTHHLETATNQYERVQKLRASNLASDEDLEDAEDSLREAQGQLDRLQAEQNAFDGQIASAEALVNLAQTQLDRTDVLAPKSGTVLVRAVEVGEVVQAGQPLGLLVDLDRLELKVYIPEGDLGKVQIGNAGRVRVSAFPERYFDARVARTDDYAQFTPRDIHVPSERTRMVYGVTLALDNPDGRLKPGMPADAWIRWDDTMGWPTELPVPVP